VTFKTATPHFSAGIKEKKPGRQRQYTK